MCMCICIQVGMTAQKTGDVGEVLVICISDGRANVPLCVSVGEPPAEDEVTPTLTHTHTLILTLILTLTLTLTAPHAGSNDP